jgi:hypothetical protein
MIRLATLGTDQFWAADRCPLSRRAVSAIIDRSTFRTAVSWRDESPGGYGDRADDEVLPTRAEAVAPALRAKFSEEEPFPRIRISGIGASALPEIAGHELVSRQLFLGNIP